MRALKMVIPSLLIGMLMAGCSKPSEQPSPESATPVAPGTPTSVAPQQAQWRPEHFTLDYPIWQKSDSEAGSEGLYWEADHRCVGKGDS